jgi:ketosteroid isomerase-like protein
LQKKASLCIFGALLYAGLSFAESPADVASQVLALERQAMNGWIKGDPDPALAIMAPDVTYFHAVTEKRLDGIEAVKALYEPYRGRPLFDSYEIIEPRVQVAGEVAVLTYDFVRTNGTVVTHWNATQVYQRRKEGWRVIHAHWSMVKPPLTGAQGR